MILYSLEDEKLDFYYYSDRNKDYIMELKIGYQYTGLLGCKDGITLYGDQRHSNQGVWYLKVKLNV